jgi:class 3 adenylate cyclase/tetratricopeptide (TPR) repeat protein
MTEAARPLDAQIDELKQSIAALEAQRAALGQAVVGPALAAMQARLDALQGQAAEQRKLVSVLFADLVGFTSLSETLDPEDVRAIQQDYFARWRAAIEAHGGLVEKFIGDAVMAVFGVPSAQEDDAERAVRAALDLHAGLLALNAERGTQLQMRAGVHTGTVVVAGSGGDYVATGDAVNLTARLQAAAPPGGVLVSHEAYQQVRGLFDAVEQPPLSVKGKAEPVLTYLVERARPGGFRALTRGVEGVETGMVGREAELLMLQKAWHDTLEDGTARLVLVVGEPGLGKTRLAEEFGLWLVDEDARPHVMRGRAAPQSAGTPAAVLRDMFGQAFGISDCASVEEMRQRFRAAVAGTLNAEQAGILGEFCGFDFSDNPAVQRLLGQDALARQGRQHLAQLITGLGRTRPVLLVVDDLHWADDRSLDALLSLTAPEPLDVPLMVLAMSRASLFERRPHWAEGAGATTRIAIQPLSRREMRRLVRGILHKLERLPDSLGDLIVNASEGNPFFAEELVKMLVDDGVIVVEQGAWRLAAERLEDVRVPPTLAGVLQARLDSLPAAEREALQAAAVAGRAFWDEAVARLSAMDLDQVAPLLAALRGRGLIYRREHSAFAGATEYAFRNQLLRDVTYETVLKRLRGSYHLQVAEWLESRAGERAGEHAGLIAYHYQQAEAGRQALRYLTLAAETALARYANPEAAAYFRQALQAHAPGHPPARAALLDGLGRALVRQDIFAEALAAWREAVELYLAEGDLESAAWLFARMGRAAWSSDDRQGSIALADEGLQRLVGAPASPGLGALHKQRGRVFWFAGQHDLGRRHLRLALEMAEATGALDVQADALATLSLDAAPDSAERLAGAQRAVDLAERAGSLTVSHRVQRIAAEQIWQRADPGDIQSAIHAARRAAELAHARGSVVNELDHLVLLVQLLAQSGDLRGAAEAREAARRLALRRSGGQPGSEGLQARLLVCEVEYQRHAGYLERAVARAMQAQVHFEALRDQHSIAEGLWHMGNMLLVLDSLAEAEAALQRCLQVEPDSGDGPLAAEAHASLALVRARQARHDEAAALLDQAAALAGPEPRRSARYWLFLAGGQAAALRADWPAALAGIEAALNMAVQAGWQWRAAEAVWQAARAQRARGDHKQAGGLFEDARVRWQHMGAEGWAQRMRLELGGHVGAFN